VQVNGNFVDRHVGPQIDIALSDTRVVVIQGARQVGKSTLASAIAGDRPSRFVTLDDEPARRSALDDPEGFVATDELLIVDEVQRVPSLLLAIKAAVDRDPSPGRYLLTGSADLLRLRSVEDSLAGRAETIELFGFSQGEIDGTVEHFVDTAFEGGLPVNWRSTVTRAGYLERACAGGYPEALGREGRRRGDWLINYAT
jgi:hypothetical protein